MADAIDFKRWGLSRVEWLHDHSQRLYRHPRDRQADQSEPHASCCRLSPRRVMPISTHRLPNFDVGRLTHGVARGKVCAKCTSFFEPLRKASFIGGCLVAPELDPNC
jgi:hypothetical protein